MFAIEKSIGFISPAFDDYYRLTAGLTVVGACTGDGKSSAAAAIATRFTLDSPDRIALVITNEETSDDFYSRIACNILELSWHAYRQNKLDECDAKRIHEEVDSLDCTPKTGEIFPRIS